MMVLSSTSDSFHSAECLWRTLCRSPTFSSPLWYSTLQKLVPWPLRAPCSIFSLRETARLLEFSLPVLWPGRPQAVKVRSVSCLVVSHSLGSHRTVHGILQAILEWVAFPSQGSNPGLLHCRFFTIWAIREAPNLPHISHFRDLLSPILCFWYILSNIVLAQAG